MTTAREGTAADDAAKGSGANSADSPLQNISDDSGVRNTESRGNSSYNSIRYSDNNSSNSSGSRSGVSNSNRDSTTSRSDKSDSNITNVGSDKSSSSSSHESATSLSEGCSINAQTSVTGSGDSRCNSSSNSRSSNMIGERGSNSRGTSDCTGSTFDAMKSQKETKSDGPVGIKFERRNSKTPAIIPVHRPRCSLNWGLYEQFLLVDLKPTEAALSALHLDGKLRSCLDASAYESFSSLATCTGPAAATAAATAASSVAIAADEGFKRLQERRKLLLSETQILDPGLAEGDPMKWQPILDFFSNLYPLSVSFLLASACATAESSMPATSSTQEKSRIAASMNVSSPTNCVSVPGAKEQQETSLTGSPLQRGAAACMRSGAAIDWERLRKFYATLHSAGRSSAAKGFDALSAMREKIQQLCDWLQGHVSWLLYPCQLRFILVLLECPFSEEDEKCSMPLLEVVRTVSMLKDEARQTLVNWYESVPTSSLRLHLENIQQMITLRVLAYADVNALRDGFSRPLRHALHALHIMYAGNNRRRLRLEERSLERRKRRRRVGMPQTQRGSNKQPGVLPAASSSVSRSADSSSLISGNAADAKSSSGVGSAAAASKPEGNGDPQQEKIQLQESQLKKEEKNGHQHPCKADFRGQREGAEAAAAVKTSKATEEVSQMSTDNTATSSSTSAASKTTTSGGSDSTAVQCIDVEMEASRAGDDQGEDEEEEVEDDLENDELAEAVPVPYEEFQNDAINSQQDVQRHDFAQWLQWRRSLQINEERDRANTPADLVSHLRLRCTSVGSSNRSRGPPAPRDRHSSTTIANSPARDTNLSARETDGGSNRTSSSDHVGNTSSVDSSSGTTSTSTTSSSGSSSSNSSSSSGGQSNRTGGHISVGNQTPTMRGSGRMPLMQTTLLVSQERREGRLRDRGTVDTMGSSRPHRRDISGAAAATPSRATPAVGTASASSEQHGGEASAVRKGDGEEVSAVTQRAAGVSGASDAQPPAVSEAARETGGQAANAGVPEQVSEARVVEGSSAITRHWEGRREAGEGTVLCTVDGSSANVREGGQHVEAGSEETEQARRDTNPQASSTVRSSVENSDSSRPETPTNSEEVRPSSSSSNSSSSSSSSSSTSSTTVGGVTEASNTNSSRSTRSGMSPRRISRICRSWLEGRLNEDRRGFAFAAEPQGRTRRRDSACKQRYNCETYSHVELPPRSTFEEETDFALLQHPFVLDAANKAAALKRQASLQQFSQARRVEMDAFFSLFLGDQAASALDHSPFLDVTVRRDHIVQDTLQHLDRRMNNADVLKKALRVHFAGEEGVDEGGVRKEFFQLLIQELFSSGYDMFLFYEESRLCWFNPVSTEDASSFRLIGMIFGLAIYNGVLLDVCFPLVIFKKLLSWPSSSLEDLEELQPTVARSLRGLLKASAADLKAMELTFSYELDHYGQRVDVPLSDKYSPQEPVTVDNCADYVSAYVDFVLNKAVADSYKHFHEGFHRCVDAYTISLFRPEELQQVILGSDEQLNFESLQSGTLYQDGFTAESETVKAFWEVAHALSSEQKKKLLMFVTGSDRVPIKGLASLRLIIGRNGADSDRLPTAHTCFNFLLLPDYKKKEKLDRLLKIAIENCKGFGLR